MLLAGVLVAAACSSDSKKAVTTPAPVASAAATPAVVATDPVATVPVTSDAAVTTPGTDTAATTEGTDATKPAGDTSSAFPDLAPPTGDEMLIGFVNTEGTPGLDFPDIRKFSEGVADYLNKHGGMGGRPIKIESCIAKGSPETSQQCAQELIAKKVELVLTGLDLFPDYAAYTAANIPVIGVLPILPGDYTADALYLTGGNATTVAAMASAAKEHYKAKTVAIVSSDNAGATGTRTALEASLDVAGISHTVVTGGDNETDAGYQGLMRQAAEGKPDLLVSLYSDAGCIGTIRGRAALGIEIPVLTTSICSGKDVIDAVGDDAVGWSFVGSQTSKDTPELKILQEMLAPVLGVEPATIDPTALGLGALGMIETMSLAEFADILQATGVAVTGESLYTYLQTAKGLRLWPNGAEIECGASAKYPTICSFTFPIAEYKAGGKVETIPGLEAVKTADYLP